MSVDKLKTMNGPFDFDAQDDTDTTLLTTAIEGRENDVVDPNTSPIEEDTGGPEKDIYGERIEAVVTVSEIDEQLKTDLEGSFSDGTLEKIVIKFTAKSKKLVITGIKYIRVDIQNKKSEIRVVGEKYDGTKPWTYTDVI